MMIDMRKSLGLAISILLVLFLLGCACPSTIPVPKPTPAPSPAPITEPEPEDSTEYAEKLAGKFCPILYLKGEEGAAENFEPEQIEIMVDAAVLRDIENPAFSEKASLRSLLEWSRSAYYLDLAELDPDAHSITEYKLAYDSVKDRYQPTIYARVWEAGGDGYTVLQYWIFYYFNDWRNFHEGDWELVQLNFPGFTAKELLESGTEPLFAAYSQHQSGQQMPWTEMMNRGLIEGSNPIVYVARGSHANYFVPGNFWSGLDFDDTGLSSWEVLRPEQLDVVLLPKVEGETEGTEWLSFRGYWGEYLGFSISVQGLKFWQRGPFGPPWGDGEQRNKKWEHPDEWATKLPEYPKPFWTSFFSLPGELANRAFFSIFSPADIHIYDSSGRHVGINEKGEIEKQIPGAVYITPEGTQYKTIVIPGADVTHEYTVIVDGTGTGKMEIKAQVPDTTSKIKRYIEYTDVPVTLKTRARVKIAPEVPLQRLITAGDSVRDTITELEIDSDGDGTFELGSRPGDFTREQITLAVITAEVDIISGEVDPGSDIQRESLVAYIELPRNLNPKGIDLSTVQLMKEIPAWKTPVDIVDHDRDGVFELMVHFDLKLVIDYLVRTKQLEGEVLLTVTGVAEGRPFSGEDSVTVSSTVIQQTERN